MQQQQSQQSSQPREPEHYTSQKDKEDHPLQKIDFCKVFMLTKKCKYGDKCENRHISYTQFRREMKKIQGPYKKHLCKKYETKGKCNNDKFFCLFAHGEKDIWGADGKEKPADEINTEKYDFRFKDQPECMKNPKYKKEKLTKNPQNIQNQQQQQQNQVKQTKNDQQKQDRNNKKAMKKLCSKFNSDFSESRNENLQKIIQFQETEKLQKQKQKVIKEEKSQKKQQEQPIQNKEKNQQNQQKNQPKTQNMSKRQQKKLEKQKYDKKVKKNLANLEKDYSSENPDSSDSSENSEDYETVSSDSESESENIKDVQDFSSESQEKQLIFKNGKKPNKQFKKLTNKQKKNFFEHQINPNDELNNYGDLLQQLKDNQSSFEDLSSSQENYENQQEQQIFNSQKQYFQQNNQIDQNCESDSDSSSENQNKLTRHEQKQQEKLQQKQIIQERKQKNKQNKQKKSNPSNQNQQKSYNNKIYQNQQQEQQQNNQNLQNQNLQNQETYDLTFSDNLDVYCFFFFDNEQESQNYQKILKQIINSETGQKSWKSATEATQYYHKNGHKGTNYFYVQISLAYNDSIKLLKLNLVKTKTYSIHFKLMPSPEIQIVFSNPCKFKSPIDNLSFMNEKNEKCYVFGSYVEQNEDQFTEYKLFDFKKTFENTRKLEQTVVAMLNSYLLYGDQYEKNEISGKIVLGVRDTCRTLEGLYSPGNIAETFFTVLKRRLSETSPSTNMSIIKKDYKVYIPDQTHTNFYPILDNKVYEITIKKNSQQKLYQSKNGLYLQRIEEGCWPIPSYKLFEQFQQGNLTQSQFENGLKKYDDRYTHVISQKIQKQIQDQDNENNFDFDEEEGNL